MRYEIFLTPNKDFMNVVKMLAGVKLTDFTCVCIFDGKLLGDIKRKNTSIFVKICEMKNESVVCWSLINCLKKTESCTITSSTTNEDTLRVAAAE